MNVVSATEILVAAPLTDDAEVVEVNIAILEADVVIDKEVLCEYEVVEVVVELSLVPCGFFALLEIDDDVEVIVEDGDMESSRSLNRTSHGAAKTH